MSQKSKETDATTSDQPIKAIEVQAVTHKIDANTAVFFTIDPQYADYVDPIAKALQEAVGHSNVTGVALPAEAIKIYQAEQLIEMSIDSSYALADIDGHGDDMWPEPADTAEIPVYRLNRWSIVKEAWKAETCFRGQVYGHPLFADGSVHYTPVIPDGLTTMPRPDMRYQVGTGNDTVIYLLGRAA